MTIVCVSCASWINGSETSISVSYNRDVEAHE